jgi:hypothetical protein
MDVKNVIAAALLFLISCAVNAKPVYLACYAGEGKERHDFTVKIDEATGKISHTSKNGAGFNAEGHFSPNEITYQQTTVVSGTEVTVQFRIDRMNLSVKRIFSARSMESPAQVNSPPIETTGTCAIVEVKNRKI